MQYHIWNGESRITIDDEQEHTRDMCVTLVDGELLSDDDEEFEDERLDVEAMDATFAEFIARYDLNDPEQRAYLQKVFTDTKTTAEAKVADHTAMLNLSEKYLSHIAAHDKKPRRRHLQ